MNRIKSVGAVCINNESNHKTIDTRTTKYNNDNTIMNHDHKDTSTYIATCYQTPRLTPARQTPYHKPYKPRKLTDTTTARHHAEELKNTRRWDTCGFPSQQILEHPWTFLVRTGTQQRVRLATRTNYRTSRDPNRPYDTRLQDDQVKSTYDIPWQNSCKLTKPYEDDRPDKCHRYCYQPKIRRRQIWQKIDANANHNLTSPKQSQEYKAQNTMNKSIYDNTIKSRINANTMGRFLERVKML
jgi:hypothetical protein